MTIAAPCFVAFIMIPEIIMRGVFMHGAFNEGDALAAAAVLTAYGFGIVPIVLIRSAVASFRSMRDTRTPMYISLFAVAVNVGLKLLFSIRSAPPVSLLRPPRAPGSICFC